MNIPPSVSDESIHHSSPHYPLLLYTLSPLQVGRGGREENLKSGWEKMRYKKRRKEKTKEMEVKMVKYKRNAEIAGGEQYLFREGAVFRLKQITLVGGVC